MGIYAVALHIDCEWVYWLALGSLCPWHARKIILCRTKDSGIRCCYCLTQMLL